MRKRKGFLVVLIVLIFFTGKELGLFDSFPTNFIIKKYSNDNFKQNTISMSTAKSGNLGNHKFSETDIFIRDLGKAPNPNEDYGLEIIIKKITIPLSYIPFYANVDYEFDAVISDNITAVKTDSVNVQLSKMAIIGNITVKGNFKSHGLLSNKEIKKIIVNDTKVFLKQEVKNYLKANE